MTHGTFFKIGSCILVCLTGLSFFNSLNVITGGPGSHFTCSGTGDGDPTPLPPNPPPPPPPGASFGFNLA